MSKGTAIDRVLAFYRTASADTVRVTHQLAVEVLVSRGIVKTKGPVKGSKQSRKPRGTAAAATAASAPAAAASQSGGQQ